MANGSPFSPRFGMVPRVLAGRRDILRDMSLVADGDLSSPSCASLLIGTRGMGKTTLLRVIEKSFAGHGWLVLAVTARSNGGLLADLNVRATNVWRSLVHDENPRGITRVSSVTVAGFGVGVEHLPPLEPDVDLRESLSILARHAREHGAGLLVTMDEIQVADLVEMREFAAIFQHESSGNLLPIVFVGAGLPEMASTLLAGQQTTFLHRCERYTVGLLTPAESRRALAEPIETSGATIAPAGLDMMLEAAAGHPHMLQTVGYGVWKAAADPAAGITLAEVEAGLAESFQDMGAGIYGPIWSGLSSIDKRLLVCMLHDGGPSSVSEIAERWGAPPSHVASHRKRLIIKGFIRAAGQGRIEFAHPQARRYVEQESDEEGWRLTPSGTPIEPHVPDPEAPKKRTISFAPPSMIVQIDPADLEPSLN